MSRHVLTVIMVAGATLLCADRIAVRAQEPAAEAIQATHKDLASSLARLSDGSRSWRNAVAAIAATGRRVFVVTPDRVRVQDGKKARPFDPDVIAEVQPLADVNARINAVVVVINLPLLEQLYSDATIAQLEADLDRILAHEVYGHAFPYLLAGHLSGKCADPLPGQPAAASCAIRRENEIRRELRLGERRSYGLDGLALAHRFRN